MLAEHETKACFMSPLCIQTLMNIQLEKPCISGMLSEASEVSLKTVFYELSFGVNISSSDVCCVQCGA